MLQAFHLENKYHFSFDLGLPRTELSETSIMKFLRVGRYLRGQLAPAQPLLLPVTEVLQTGVNSLSSRHSPRPLSVRGVVLSGSVWAEQPIRSDPMLRVAMMASVSTKVWLLDDVDGEDKTAHMEHSSRLTAWRSSGKSADPRITLSKGVALHQ